MVLASDHQRRRLLHLQWHHHRSRTHFTPNPNTVVIDDYTFVSPTNYMSFSGLEGISRTRKYDHFTTCGGVSYDKVIVPVTGAMSTKGLDYLYSSFNLEHLNT